MNSRYFDIVDIEQGYLGRHRVEATLYMVNAVEESYPREDWKYYKVVYETGEEYSLEEWVAMHKVVRPKLGFEDFDKKIQELSDEQCVGVVNKLVEEEVQGALPDTEWAIQLKEGWANQDLEVLNEAAISALIAGMGEPTRHTVVVDLARTLVQDKRSNEMLLNTLYSRREQEQFLEMEESLYLLAQKYLS